MDVCLEMQRALGSRPWSDERVEHVCGQWETRWQARVLAAEESQGGIADLDVGAGVANASKEAMDPVLQDKAKLARLATVVHTSFVDGSIANKSNSSNLTLHGVNRTIEGTLCNKSAEDWPNSTESCRRIAAVLMPQSGMPPSLGLLLDSSSGQGDRGGHDGQPARLFVDRGFLPHDLGNSLWFAASLAAAAFATTVALSLRRWRSAARDAAFVEPASDSEEGEALMGREWGSAGEGFGGPGGQALLGPLD